MEISLKVRTADTVESHSSDGLESIFEPREDTKSGPIVTGRNHFREY